MTGGAAAAAAAAAKKRRERREEEKMTKYDNSDMEGWEFKILRSSFGRFGNRKFLDEVCRQEARAGWEFLEKFDNQRIRFKRLVEKRAGDRHLDFDPYRTHVGANAEVFAVALGIGIALIAILVALLVNR